MNRYEKANLEQQLESYRYSLALLEEQGTAFGQLYIPAFLITEIENCIEEIVELEEKLGLPITGKSGNAGQPQIPWNIPHNRNPHFSGREDELLALEKMWDGGKISTISQPLAISGPDGVGKTQLAVEYAFRNREKFKFVWWLGAETAITLNTGLRQLASELKLPAALESDQKATNKAVVSWLEENGGWLLIYDNLIEPSEIEELLPRRGGQILITSGWQDWSGFAETLSVKSWDNQQAVEFLLKRTKRGSLVEAEQLAEELGGLPLVLEYAGAYLAKYTNLTFADYLQEFKERKLALLNEGKLSQLYETNVSTTWEMALQKLPKAAGDLLKLWVWFAPDDIPLDILERYGEELPETLAKVAAKKTDLSKVVATLQEHSLLEVIADGRAVSIHRLLQIAIRQGSQEQEARSKEPESEDGSKSATQHFWLSTALGLLKSAFPDFYTNQTSWLECFQLLPHVLVATEEGRKLEIEPGATSHLLFNVGINLWIRQENRITALSFLEHCLAIQEKIFEPDHSSLFITYNHLGMMHKYLGNYPKAVDYYQKALAIEVKKVGADHHSLGLIYDELGEIFQALGDYPQAKSYYYKDLAIVERVLEPNPKYIAQSYNGLGEKLQAMGDYPQAQDYYRKALAIFEKEVEPDYRDDYRDLARSYHNLGTLLYITGEYPQAKEYLQKALAIREKVLEADHFDLAISYSNLGGLLYAIGEYPQAQEYLQKVLTIGEKVLKADDPNLAIGYNNLGQLLRAKGDYLQAKEYLQKGLAILSIKLGDDNPNTRLVRSNLESLEGKMGPDLTNLTP